MTPRALSPDAAGHTLLDLRHRDHRRGAGPLEREDRRVAVAACEPGGVGLVMEDRGEPRGPGLRQLEVEIQDRLLRRLGVGARARSDPASLEGADPVDLPTLVPGKLLDRLLPGLRLFARGPPLLGCRAFLLRFRCLAGLGELALEVLDLADEVPADSACRRRCRPRLPGGHPVEEDREDLVARLLAAPADEGHGEARAQREHRESPPPLPLHPTMTDTTTPSHGGRTNGRPNRSISAARAGSRAVSAGGDRR